MKAENGNTTNPLSPTFKKKQKNFGLFCFMIGVNAQVSDLGTVIHSTCSCHLTMNLYCTYVFRSTCIFTWGCPLNK